MYKLPVLIDLHRHSSNEDTGIRVSPAAQFELVALFPGIRHAFAMMRGEGHPGAEAGP